MTSLRELCRLGACVLAPLALATSLLVACGGGTSQVEAFKPTRLIVFGDENSVIENDGNNDGFKYTINDRSGDSVGKCTKLPIFTQSVALVYGFAFAECNPNALAPQAFIRAQRLAKVDDPNTGISQQMANQGDLNSHDMVTVMIGINDIIEIYERTQSGVSGADAIDEARRRGSHLAAQINAMLRTGARALVFTIPDVGQSPYAVNANLTDPGAATLLTRLTTEFNAYLRTNIDSANYDGRNYGLILADDIVGAMHKLPASFLVAPALPETAACNIANGLAADVVATAVLACNTTNLVDGAAANSHLWASDRHIGPAAHARIGAQAQQRATTNPF